MKRRQVVGFCAGISASVLAGCLGDGDGTADTPAETTTEMATATETGTPTETRTPTGTASPNPTESPAGSPTGSQGRVEYTVVNDDDVTHEVEVTLTTADGTVTEEAEKSLSPGESLSGTSTGNDPGRSPYDLTVSFQSSSVTSELKLDECPAYNFGFSVTPDGSLSVEREICQK